MSIGRNFELTALIWIVSIYYRLMLATGKTPNSSRCNMDEYFYFIDCHHTDYTTLETCIIGHAQDSPA